MDILANVKGEGLGQPGSTPGQSNIPQTSPDKIYAEKLNMLARQERMFRQREAQFKDMERKLSEYESKFSKLKESPLEGLEEFGLNYADLVAKGLTQDPTAKLESKIARLEQMLTEKNSKEEQTMQEQQRSEWIGSIRDGLKDKEDFDLINTLQAHSQVLDFIENHYEETGEQLDLEEAAKHIEADLAEKLKVFQHSKKMRSLFEARAAESSESVEEKLNNMTLSNSMPTGSILPNSSEPLGENARIQAAIAMLKANKRQ